MRAAEGMGCRHNLHLFDGSDVPKGFVKNGGTIDLLPLIPACALIFTYALFANPLNIRRKDFLPAGLCLAALGTILFLMPYLAPYYAWWPLWSAHISPFAPLSLVLGGVLLIAIRASSSSQGLTALSLAGVLFVMIVDGAVTHAASASYDPKKFVAHLHHLQGEGIRIAHYGQYQFPGRLQPLDVVRTPAEVRQWLQHYPQGRLITYSGTGHPRSLTPPEYTQIYRSSSVEVWKGESLLADEAWVKVDKSCLDCFAKNR